MKTSVDLEDAFDRIWSIIRQHIFLPLVVSLGIYGYNIIVTPGRVSTILYSLSD